VLVVGPNGAGKTNLLEAVHVGAQGFSPRTRTDADLVRFGAEAGRIGLRGDQGASPVEIEIRLRAGDAKRATLNGAPLRTAEQLRGVAAALVFTPDRLAIVKGGPSVRRAYFDRALGRAWPGRSALSAEYASAVGQRNASLRRVAAGASSQQALAPWTHRVAELGAQLVAARHELVLALRPRFVDVAGELGLDAAALNYEGADISPAVLDARVERDLERGTTGAGPHLDDVDILAGGRELRGFGSQGEQRLAVLSLLLAEAELLFERRRMPPLLLLDDVLSELDDRRRHLLAERIKGRGQALVTATSAAALPDEPDALVEVASGVATRVPA
jgi:DNA replication and repair protein RecF